MLGDAIEQRNNIFETYQRNLDLVKTVLKIDETKIGYRDKTNINNLTKWCGLLFKALNIPTRGSFEQRLNRIKQVLLNGESLSITKADNIPIQFNYGNYYITAENVWNAINEPVTRDNLFLGKPVEVDTDKYYQSVGRREDSLTFRMQEFHNKYVKTSLMWAAALEAKENGVDDIKLLDLCCGKGGDLFKWEKTNIKKVLGIDVSRDNIYNRENGACVRYMNYQKKNQYRDDLMEIDFLVGDCGNSIRMLEAFSDTKSETYYKENYLMGDGYPIKFDIVSCQFAIHYFFDNYDRVQTFIDNVDEHIKKGGIFIGTCLDGNTVYNKICDEYRSTGKTRVISKDKYNNTIWSIEGLFDCEGKDFTRGDPVNFDINIQLASITGEGFEYKESLVNFGYLQMLFEKRGFKLIKNTLNNIPGESLFGKLYDKYYEKIKDDRDKQMSEAEKNLSYMYRYFVFKKM